ncbi:L-arabinose 1-dehydrogenase (NAD(P)(+)) [uncultured archaeon]|nr:L-arabinose 1-dehydrogenase (NAD(P)(+)) [uncultured archaeon]
MKIFITGSLGYFGKPLIAQVSNAHEVIGYDLINGEDILNYAQLKESMQGCDMVVHAAAITKPVEVKSFDEYFQVNCVGTMNVVNAAIENKVKRLVFISSTAYYGVERGVPAKFPLKEDQQTIPMYLKAEDLKCENKALMYSQSKVIAENILAFYGLTKQIQIICLRFPRIGDKEGPHGTHVSMSNAISGVMKSIEKKGTLWFEAFNISDKLEMIDISKAKKILGYLPL